MHGYSRFGVGSKMFFGLNAKTFGNPHGLNPAAAGVAAIPWTPQAKFITEVGIVAMAFGHDLAHSVSYMLISANNDNSGLGVAYNSADGVHWTKKGNLPAGIWFRAGTFVLPPPQLIFSNGSWIIAGVDSQPGVGASNGTVAISSDAGATWTTHLSNVPGHVTFSTLASNGGAELVVVCQNDSDTNFVAVSENSGVTWTATSAFPNGSVFGSLFWDGVNHYFFIGSEQDSEDSAVASLQEGQPTWTYTTDAATEFAGGGILRGDFVSVGAVAPLLCYRSGSLAGLLAASGKPTPSPGAEEVDALAIVCAGTNIFVFGDGTTANVWNSPDGTNFSPASKLVPVGVSHIMQTGWAYNPLNGQVLVGDLVTGIVSTATST